MDLEAWLAIGGLAFGIVTGLGGLIAYFQKSRGEALNKLLESENSILTAKNNRLEKEKAESEANRKAAEARAKTLEDLVTAAPAITKLTSTLSKQHTDTTRILHQIIKSLKK